MLSKLLELFNQMNLYEIMVLQDGHTIASYRRAKEQPRDVYSITKTITALGIGFAIEEGLLSLNTPVLPYFESELSSQLSSSQLQKLQQLTLYHLLTMTAGFRKAGLMYKERAYLTSHNITDWAGYTLSTPIDAQPGTQFLYTNSGPYLAGILLEKAAETDMVSYLTPRLWNPLKIKPPNYITCPKGHVFGSSGMTLTVSDLAAIGQFLLQKGYYNNQRILSEKFIQLCMSKQIGTNAVTSSPFGYGLGLWLERRDIVLAEGKLGQLILVIPHKNMVIAVSAKEANTKLLRQRMLDSVFSDP